MPHPAASSRSPRNPRENIAILLAFAALVAAANAHPVSAWLALVLALASLAAWGAAHLRGKTPGAHRWLTLSAALVAGVIAATTLRPLPTPDLPLTQASARIQQAWQALIFELGEAVGESLETERGFPELEKRRQVLGPDAGVAVLRAENGSALAWAGWSTPLSTEELATVRERSAAGPAIVVLRRGLSVRLLYGRLVLGAPGEGDLLLTAERALEREPSLGVLGEELSPAIKAFVRWEGLGEGIRGELGQTDGAPGGVSLWSMLPLFAPGEEGAAKPLAGMVTVGLVPAELREANRQQRRRNAALWALAAAALALALANARRYWLLLIVTRVALALVGFESESTGWGLTGLTLVGLATLAPLPAGRGARSVLSLLGLAGAAGGLVLSWWLTTQQGLAPGELLLGGTTFGSENSWHRLAAIFALTSVCWAGLVLLLRITRFSPPWALTLAGALGGVLAGGVHAAALAPAGRQQVEQILIPQIENRESLWNEALLETLRLAVPPPGEDVLARDRDAIDLWWNSPLAREGLASGVWKYDERGELEDEFLTGLPPLAPGGLLAGSQEDLPGPDLKTFSDPELVEMPFLGSYVPVIVAEFRRPEGGSWVAAIRAEPNNLPHRTRDALRGARSAGRKTAFARLLEHVQLAWFDQDGRLLASDLESGPPAPLAGESAGGWRDVSLGGRRATQIEVREDGGTVTALFFLPDLLERSAIALAWAVLLAGFTLLARSVAAVQQDPRGAATTLAQWARRAGTHFRVQVTFALILAGLIPLLALAGAGRAAAIRQENNQMVSAASLSLHTARRLVEDMETLNEERALGAEAGNRIAAWLSRTLGDDLFVWKDGELLATSRPDLVRAGLWPRRIAGDTFQALSVERRTMLVESLRLETDLDLPPQSVAHGLFEEADGANGALSVPLSRAGRLAQENLAEVDRALLVSAALLIALIALLTTPATRRLVRPLEQLRLATAKIAGGRFDAPIPETGYEETRVLSRAFRTMATSLADQRRGLERRRAAIETIIASIPLAVIALSRDGKVWAANPQASQLLDARPGEELPPAEGSFREAVQRTIEQAGEVTLTLEATREDQTQHYQVSALDLPALSEGQPLRLVLIEDLTDTIRSERLTAWAEMARRIAHEIKNPLTPISLVVEHIRVLAERGDPRLPDKLDHALSTIAEQVDVLKEASREFGDYARLIRAVPEAIDLPASLNSWVAGYLLAPPEGITLRLEGPEQMSPLTADPRLLRRAVINLVDNALAAVERGGQVVLRWQPRESTVEIAVEDDGAGIPASALSHLFEPDVTTRETGSGLGLPIARQAIEAHDGTIEVDSTPGKGTVFTIILPLKMDS